MASVLRSLTSLLLITLILVFSFIPRPTTSFPVIMLGRTKDHSSLTSSLSIIIMDGPQIFGIAFALAWFLALLCIWAWIANRMAVTRFINRIIWILAAPTNIAQYLSQIAQQLSYIEQQLSYLRFSTIIRVATATILDADDARRPSPRRGGVANPVSSAPRTRSQWARFRGGGQGMRGNAGRTGNVPIGFTSPV